MNELKSLALFLMMIFLASCGPGKSKIDPAFEAKTFYEATKGRPVKIILPITHKTMGILEPPALSEGSRIEERSFAKRTWEQVKNSFFDLAAWAGITKLKMSVTHDMTAYDLTPQFFRENTRSVRISKAFFTMSKPCENKPSGEECKEYVTFFKGKEPSFSMIEKAFVNISLIEKDKNYVDNYLKYDPTAGKVYKKANLLLQKPQENITSASFKKYNNLTKNYNLAYFNKLNNNLEERYFMQNRSDSRKNIVLVSFNDIGKIAKTKKVILDYLGDQLGVPSKFRESVFAKEIIISPYSIIVDLNPYIERVGVLSRLTKKFRSFLKSHGLKNKECNKYLCARPKRSAAILSLVNKKDLAKNVIVIQSGKTHKLKKEIIRFLAEKTQIKEKTIARFVRRESKVQKGNLYLNMNRLAQTTTSLLKHLNSFKSKEDSVASKTIQVKTCSPELCGDYVNLDLSEKVYTLKKKRKLGGILGDNYKNVLIMSEPNEKKLKKNYQRVKSFLTKELSISVKDFDYLHGQDLSLKGQNLILDLNNFSKTSLRKKTKKFLLKEKMSFSKCNKKLCGNKEDNGKLDLSSMKDIKNVLLVKTTKENFTRNLLTNIIAKRKGLAPKMVKKIITRNTVNLNNYLLVDLNRFADIKSDISQKLVESQKKSAKKSRELVVSIDSCSKGECFYDRSTSQAEDNVAHLNKPVQNLKNVFLIEIDEKRQVQEKNKILDHVAKELGRTRSQLAGELSAYYIPMHDQIILNLNGKEQYLGAFKRALNYHKKGQYKSCTNSECLFLATSNQELRNLLMKGTTAEIDIFMNILKMPRISLYLKGYIELEIVLDF